MNAFTNAAKGAAKSAETESTEAAAPAVHLPDLAAGGTNLGELATAEEEAAKTHHYSSLPIQNYALGRFQFTNGWLSLSDEDAAEFEDNVRAQPPTERNRISKFANRPQAPQPIAMTQGIDNSANAPAAPSGTQEA